MEGVMCYLRFAKKIENKEHIFSSESINVVPTQN